MISVVLAAATAWQPRSAAGAPGRPHAGPLASVVRPLEKACTPESFVEACSAAPIAVVLFQSERCLLCRAFAPKYARLAKKYGDEAIFFTVVATQNAELCASEQVLTLLPCVNVYVGGCSVRSLSVSDKRTVQLLTDEIDRCSEPGTLEAMLEKECDLCPLPSERQDDGVEVTQGLFALFCSVGLLSRAAAVYDALELAALFDGLEVTQALP